MKDFDGEKFLNLPLYCNLTESTIVNHKASRQLDIIKFLFYNYNYKNTILVARYKP
jgi:hypothetical protein